MERENTQEVTWGFKSYEKLAEMAIKNKQTEEFERYFVKMADIFERIDHCHKVDTVRNITYYVSEHKDDELTINILRFMLNILMDKNLERDIIDTGLQLAKSLFNLNRNEELGEIIDTLLTFLDRMDNLDEAYNQNRLELLVLRIQYYNNNQNFRDAKKTFMQANTFKDSVVSLDEKLAAIIDEEGGKVFMSQKNYDKALTKFKQAFTSHRNAGHIESAKKLMKYSLLMSMGSKNRNFLDTTDAKM